MLDTPRGKLGPDTTIREFASRLFLALILIVEFAHPLACLLLQLCPKINKLLKIKSTIHLANVFFLWDLGINLAIDFRIPLTSVSPLSRLCTLSMLGCANKGK